MRQVVMHGPGNVQVDDREDPTATKVLRTL